ncbi:DUF2971 domain-containing protein [Bordetella sp. 2513F-2]
MDDREIVGIFMPYALHRMEEANNTGLRFAHYTTAETGFKILDSGHIFLRNSSLMNDFSEVRHGCDCLVRALDGPAGERLKAALSDINPGLPRALESSLHDHLEQVLSQTYLMSISEHLDHEDEFGRLSMWRAYAPENGIAFVLNNRPFVTPSNALGAYTSPVLYTMPDDRQPAFEEVVSSIERHIEILRQLGGTLVLRLLIHAFRFAVQSTKHPAFREEREWRVIYSPLPTTLQETQSNDRIPMELISLGGVPQRIYKIPFRDYPEEGFVGATIPALLDRVLIGPSTDANTIAEAYVDKLTQLNVPDAQKKIVVTGIPLRN